MTSNSTSKPSFRYDINFLRAVAVIGVVLYHYKVPYFAGGFSGVDIFFVISGYLMTRIILNGIDAGSFSVSNFYGSRLKRIVPALMVMILIITIVGFFIYLPQDYQLNEKNAASSLLFFSNMYYWAHSGYFDAGADNNILLHTWSLSVEWQFYMIYPLALLLLNKVVKKRTSFTLIFIIITVLITLVVIYIKYNPKTLFFYLPFRSWEMMAGGVALLTQDKLKQFKFRSILAFTGYLILLGCIVFLNEEMAWPGVFTIIPVFATFIVIVSNQNDFKILSNNLSQFLGKISYSLYLWHWPILVFISYYGLKFNAILIVLLLGVSVLLAYLSFKYVESARYVHNKRIIFAMTLMTLMTGTLGFTLSNRFLFKSQVFELSSYATTHIAERDKQFDQGGCFLNLSVTPDGKFDTTQCLSIDSNGRNFVLLGDSHAAHFSQSFKEYLSKHHAHLIQASASSCLPIITKNGGTSCFDMVHYVYNNFVKKNTGKIDGIILSGNWTNYYGEPTQLATHLENTISFLKKVGIKTIIIGQNELYSKPYPSVIALQMQYDLTKLETYLLTAPYKFDAVLKKRLPDNYVSIINQKSSIPGFSKNNVPYLFDANHFTKYGADLTIDKMEQNPIFRDFFDFKGHIIKIASASKTIPAIEEIETIQ